MRNGLAFDFLSDARRLLVGGAAAALLGLAGPAAFAQPPEPIPAPKGAEVDAKRVTDPNYTSPGLTRCVQIALEKQPSLAAARASLNAARSGQAGLGSIRGLPRFLSKDLPVREQQAAAGITAKEADVWQMEWDTVANVTRAYWLVVYATEQRDLIQHALANEYFKQRIDLVLDPEAEGVLVQRARLLFARSQLRSRLAEAEAGIERARALLREAAGVDPDCDLPVTETRLPDPFQPTKSKEGTQTTAVVLLPLTKEATVAMALERRGELAQAKLLATATDLEIQAQAAVLCRLLTNTFAAGSDIHSKPVPAGDRGRDFRPAALAPEMPGSLAGTRPFRVDRAAAFNDRAGAVVDKTCRLLTLEAEDTFLRLVETTRKVAEARVSEEEGRELQRPAVLKDAVSLVADPIQNTSLFLDLFLSATRERATYPDALVQQLSVLAELQRITAGGYSPPFAPNTPAPAGH